MLRDFLALTVSAFEFISLDEFELDVGESFRCIPVAFLTDLLISE